MGEFRSAWKRTSTAPGLADLAEFSAAGEGAYWSGRVAFPLVTGDSVEDSAGDDHRLQGLLTVDPRLVASFDAVDELGKLLGEVVVALNRQGVDFDELAEDILLQLIDVGAWFLSQFDR